MNEKNKYKPNKKQALFIDLYIDLNNRLTLTQICEEVGITRQTAWRWFQDQNFTDFLNSKRNEILTRSQTARMLVAVKEALSGDFSFSKLLFELEGIYSQAVKMRGSEDIKVEIQHVAKKEKEIEKELINKFNLMRSRVPLKDRKAYLERELQKVNDAIRNGEKEVKIKEPRELIEVLTMED